MYRFPANSANVLLDIRDNSGNDVYIFIARRSVLQLWHYVEEGQAQGPVTAEVLAELLKAGRLFPETLVWTDGMDGWVEMRLLAERIFDGNPPQELSAETSLPQTDGCPQIRPWVRYWARSLDYLLWGFVLGLVMLLIYEPFLHINPFLFSFIATLVFVFVESAMLCSWGTTPGKALLKISVHRGDGALPGFNEALTRSLRVWVRGVGMSIPLLTLITQANAYARLTRDGVTSWDSAGNMVVRHQRIGPLRIAAVVFIFAVFMLLIVAGVDAGSGQGL